MGAEDKLRNQALVVEDDATSREALVEVFEAEGFNVQAAGDGEAALAKVRKQQFDLIILDIMMPKLDGFGFLEKLQPRQACPETKIVVFSNMFSIDAAKKAKDLGAFLYYAKAALTPRDLVEAVR